MSIRPGGGHLRFMLMAALLWVLLWPAAAAAAGPGTVAVPPPGGLAASERSLPSPGDLAEQQLDTSEAQALREVLQRMNAQLSPYVPHFTWDDFRGYLHGQGWHFDPAGFVRGLARFFAGEVMRNLGLLGELVLLAVLSSLLVQLRVGMAGGTVARVAEAVVFLALAGVALAGFYSAVRIAAGAVNELHDVMMAALPLLIALLTATGAWVSAGLLRPLLLFFVNAVSVLSSSVVFPLLFFGAVLDLVSIFAAPFSVSGLAKLMRQASLGVLAFALTAFVGIVSVEGLAGAVSDGVGLRTAKYVASTFVPVIGKIFSDAADLVASASMLVRSGAGVLALFMVLVAVAFPLLKLISLILAYRLGAALVQPLGATGVVQLLGAVSDALTMLTLVVGAVALMFFLAISAMVAAGSAITMLR